MFNENNKGIGLYIFYSAIFHILLIGLILYFSIKYRPQVQSIGSKVVVSIVSRVPGPLASVKSILYPPKPKLSEHAPSRPSPVKVKAAKPVSVPLVKTPSSMVYPKKTVQKHVAPRRYVQPHPYVPVLSSSVYANLQNKVSLNNAYGKINQSLIKGNVHRFQGYVNKIISAIIPNFGISLNHYLNYKSIVAFQISKSGRIYDVRLVKSSGSGYYDSQSVAAVKLSSPLPPPPAGFMNFENDENDGEGVLMIFNPRQILKDR
jgi:TonB family protein